jgi:N-succinyldiaminopimelate aminotransferase
MSDATRGLTSSVYTTLSALAKENAPEVFALNVGDTYLLPPACARVESLRTADLPGLHNYAEVRGEPALLDAICVDLEARGRAVARERLQVTAGATSGLDLICRTLLSPGDEVIVLAPFWPLVRGIVSATGARAVEVPFFTRLDEHGFDLTRTIADAINERTVAIYVNSPHNPTGAMLRSPEIDALAQLCEAHDLWLLCDEAYEALYFDAPPSAVWQHPKLDPRALVAHTLSKSHGLAGARIGYVHGPAEVMSRLSGLQTFTTYCAARPMQIAASRALTFADGQAFPAELRALYKHACELAADALGVPAPKSGTFLFFDTRPYLREGESSHALLERAARAGVVLTPGQATGNAFADYARLCTTCVPPDTLARAMEILSRVLRDR